MRSAMEKLYMSCTEKRRAARTHVRHKWTRKAKKLIQKEAKKEEKSITPKEFIFFNYRLCISEMCTGSNWTELWPMERTHGSHPCVDFCGLLQKAIVQACFSHLSWMIRINFSNKKPTLQFFFSSFRPCRTDFDSCFEERELPFLKRNHSYFYTYQ